jgi:hypothetical protein
MAAAVEKKREEEEEEEEEIAVGMCYRRSAVLLGDSITQNSFETGGWGAVIAHACIRRVRSLCDCDCDSDCGEEKKRASLSFCVLSV